MWMGRIRCPCLFQNPQDAKKTNAFFSFSRLFLLQMLSISIWEAFNISSSYH